MQAWEIWLMIRSVIRQSATPKSNVTGKTASPALFFADGETLSAVV